MDAEFWHERWASKNIGFHENQPNASLVQHLNTLQLEDNAHVFVPLCGKSLDIGWLRKQGFAVSAVELSEIAVKELFKELQISPVVTPSANDGENLLCYAVPGLQIYVGDLFLLKQQHFSDIDAVYDRAALVALPPEMRHRYARHLQNITKNAPQLLVTFDYDQNQMAGPPHAVPAQEVKQHYSKTHRITKLSENSVDGKLKGKVTAQEVVWHLAPLL